jgi:23S rRNA pseudouridine1911/1915/1917 synthase
MISSEKLATKMGTLPYGNALPSRKSQPECGRSSEKTISDWFIKKYPKTKNVGEPFKLKIDNCELIIDRPGIVHRLDKETSGVLILAKTQKAYEFLKNQFKNRELRKVYNVIVLGSVKNDRGVIRKPIGRSPSDFRKRLAGRGARGELKEAVTEYTVLKKFEDQNIKYSYLEVRPKTGRTHQIRVHMKFINHPVAHDDLYNPNSPYPKGFKRLALHAKSIEFKDLKDKVIKIEAPIPKEFVSILKKG